jgi:hypothetical protein
MAAVRGVMPPSGSAGGGADPGWRAPHLAQNACPPSTWFPQLLQKGIYHTIRYVKGECSGKPVARAGAL